MTDHGGDAVAFFDLYSRGDVSATAIDDFIDTWHISGDDEERPLAACLGMTEDEHAVWLIDPHSLPIILSARRSGVPPPTLVAAYPAELCAANDPRDATSLWSLSYWTARHSAP
jgi:hypothetical protein